MKKLFVMFLALGVTLALFSVMLMAAAVNWTARAQSAEVACPQLSAVEQRQREPVGQDVEPNCPEAAAALAVTSTVPEVTTTTTIEDAR